MKLAPNFCCRWKSYITAKCNETYLFRKLRLVHRLQPIISIFAKYVSGYCFIPAIVKPLDVTVALFTKLIFHFMANFPSSPVIYCT